MNNLDESEKIKIFIETLNKEIESYTPWASRKEIAAWTAIAFYIALIGFFIDFILKFFTNDINIFSFFLQVIPLYLIMVILSLIFFIFIHSQFSSIYDRAARTNAIRNTIFKVLQENSLKSIDFEINEEQNILISMIDELNKQKEWIRPTIQFHPINILLDLWTFQWLKKYKKSRYKTHARQEAAIYSLILLSYLFMSLILFKIFINTF